VEAVNSQENPYFRTERKPARLIGSQWRAAADIVRKDTDELVEHIRVRETSAEIAEQRLATAIEAKLKALQRPTDWGRDPTIPHLLQRYLEVRDQLYGIAQRAEEAAALPEAAMLKRDAEAYEHAEFEALRKQVAQLTEQQRLELATPTEDHRANREDARVLDTLTAKKRLSQLIPNPSPAVQAAYRRLEQVLNM
jgi:hypothetical protein